jgi:ketosteroid isomerase-like protein
MGTNASIVEAAYAAFGRGDISGLLDLVDEHVEWSSPRTLPQGGEYHGKLAVAKFFENVGAAWDPLTLELEEIGEVGDGVVVGVARLDGTRRGGEAAGYGSTHVFRVRDGKIVGFREYTDLSAPIA